MIGAARLAGVPIAAFSLALQTGDSWQQQLQRLSEFMHPAVKREILVLFLED